ncbi:MAG TPA: metallopeptidase family protein [Patescibacteria group bacterium]|nr:metallopeptidase family protein [Patescibacteria group bacterium]
MKAAELVFSDEPSLPLSLGLNIISFMDDQEFGKIIDQALKELPQEFKDKMENVAIVIADWPTVSQMNLVGRNQGRGLLLGLYEGIPQTKRRNYGIGGPLPDKITIFKIPLLRISNSYENAVVNIKNTVIHEIAHHFGMSEEDIEKTKVRD